jgi:hypothetical protein
MNKLKVLISSLFVACLGIGVVSAQASTTGAPAAKQTPKTKSSAKAKSSTAANSTSAKPAQHLKKDGTPDMRYKENKAAKPATTAPAEKKNNGPYLKKTIPAPKKK